MAANVLLETLQLEVTCPLCLDIFKRPKKLPCDHVYCQECLHQLALVQKRANNSISCPECRTPALASSPDCSNFPTPFHINRLIEMYEKGVREAEDSTDGAARVSEVIARGGPARDGPARDGPATEPASCGTHRSQTLSLYCQTCEKLVCRDCIMFSCAKSQHSYGYVEDVLEKHKSALSAGLFTVKELQLRVKGTLDRTREVERKIDEKEEKVVEEVDAAFKQLFDVLGEEKSTLLTDLRRKFEDARIHNSIRRGEVAAVCVKLEEVMSYGSLSGSGASFLAKLKTRKSGVDEVIKRAHEVEHPDPVKLSDMGFSVLKPGKLREVCRSSNTTVDKCGGTLECHFEGGVKWNDIPLESPSFVPLCLDTDATPIPKLEAHLCCCYSKEQYPIQVKMDGGSLYVLAIRPQERGRHELHVKHNGRHVSVSPAQLYVTAKPSNPRRERCYTLNRPMGVKCDGEFVYVSELGSGVAILQPRTLNRVSTISMPNVWEVYVDFNTKLLYGTDNRLHLLKMMTMEGTLLKCIGGKGKSPGKFCWPNGIRCSKNGEIFVCDSVNNRIQVFDKNLGHLYILDSPILSTPDDLDFDEDGNLYVANQGANNVVVLSPWPQSALLRTIGKVGSEYGKLNNPISVAVHKNLVYVTDTGNKRISVFTTRGEFVTVFGEGVLEAPECIAIDRDGFIYVTDKRSKMLVF